ncbi:NAD-dependent succinate-semialdehyde dehydrogenase [Geofilum sp. OHC36d9]|uniref:NAD-dependent succinate-semialdehyde dehydrogenase n=1 Tax=Geofilum sp. OHC36d9 TaxID=3458413 RepID=UPI0040337D00
MLIRSVNPATNEVVREFEEMQMSEVDEVLDHSLTAFYNWRKVSLDKRRDLILCLAVLLEAQREGLAYNISIEMGKPIRQSRAEIDKCSWLCRYYADHAEAFLCPEVVETSFSSSRVVFRPLGPVLAIMPWNFPFWQVLRFSVPALLAGNTVILKHASNVSGCALAIEQLMKEAGFPFKVFQTILLSSNRISRVIGDRRIRAVTFTGSTPAGQAVGSAAGQSLKKSVLELGGSDPYIILADADVKKAAEACVKARLANAGQSCISAKRFIVEAPVFDEFQQFMVQGFSKVKMGDPLNDDTDLGPIARVNLRLDLEAQVNNSIEKGAGLVLGGAMAGISGNYYPPTILNDVNSGMPAWHDELFGPVAALIKVQNAEEAVSVANDTNYGLGAAIFTSDLDRGIYLADNELEVGTCFVNDFVRSDPRLPFGGVKDSGYGRELGLFGLREFVNVKTVVVC